MSSKILIVGLGNIGLQYAYTRHNSGFIAVDYIADSLNIKYCLKPKFRSEVGVAQLMDKTILIAKPNTYMNLSGVAVASICSYNKIPTDNVFVIYDDLDLELGKVKLKFAGGSAGHNGIKSLDQNIGVDYYRIRIGIGRPLNHRFTISDYVLSKFTDTEYEKIMLSIRRISDNINYLFTKQVEEFKKQIS